MEFAYLDESGDLGSKGSNYLVLTLMCTGRKKELIKIIRDTKKDLLSKNKCSKWLNRNAGEIKYYNFPDKNILERALRKLSKIKIVIYYLAIEKNGDPIPMQYKVSILGNLFRHIHEKCGDNKPQKIIADLNFFNDKKVNRFLLMDYKIYGINESRKTGSKPKKGEISFAHLKEEDYQSIKDDKTKMVVSIEHHNSRLNEELQALDLISGCIFSKVEKGDGSLLKILESDNLKVEGAMFLKK